MWNTSLSLLISWSWMNLSILERGWTLLCASVHTKTPIDDIAFLKTKKKTSIDHCLVFESNEVIGNLWKAHNSVDEREWVSSFFSLEMRYGPDGRKWYWSFSAILTCYFPSSLFFRVYSYSPVVLITRAKQSQSISTASKSTLFPLNSSICGGVLLSRSFMKSLWIYISFSFPTSSLITDLTLTAIRPVCREEY